MVSQCAKFSELGAVGFARHRGSSQQLLTSVAGSFPPQQKSINVKSAQTAIPSLIFCSIRLETAMAEEERQQANVFGDLN